jgi:hypothetical protein
MVERAITRFIDVEIRKATPGVASAEFGLLLCITPSNLLTTGSRVNSFTSVSSVENFYGEDSEEARYADAYFNQDPEQGTLPEELLFGRYVNTSIAAVLECGNNPLTNIATWQAITDGEVQVTSDSGVEELIGLDFSTVTSLDDVATVIDTALTDISCTWNQVNRFIFTSNTVGATSTISLLSTVTTPVGTDISGTGFLDGDILKSPSNPGGSIISAGQDAEIPADCIQAIRDINDAWAAGGALRVFRDTTDAQDFAAVIEGLRKIFILASNDSNTLVSGDTSSITYTLRDLNYRRTAFNYYDIDTLYPDASWLGGQLPKSIGSSNWAYKPLAGIAQGAAYDIPASELTQAQIDAALNVNCNVYTETLGSSYMYLGTMVGGRNTDKDGEFIDIVRNIDFLQARVEEGLLNLFLERDIIPYTDGGISLVDNRLKSLLDTYGVKQGILVEDTVVTSFPSRSEVSITDRNDRLLPDGTFTAELVGGVNRVIIRGTVFV